MTEIKAALETDLKPEALTAVLEGWAKARLAALEEAAKAEDPKAAALILAELIGGARAALDAAGPVLEGWGNDLAAQIAGMAGDSRVVFDGFGALGLEARKPVFGEGALMDGGGWLDSARDFIFGKAPEPEPEQDPVKSYVPYREPPEGESGAGTAGGGVDSAVDGLLEGFENTKWSQPTGRDHEIDPVSGEPYDIQTIPNGPGRVVVDDESGRDYFVIPAAGEEAFEDESTAKLQSEGDLEAEQGTAFDHEHDPVSNMRYDIQTDEEGDSETKTDPESGRDYEVITEYPDPEEDAEDEDGSAGEEPAAGTDDEEETEPDAEEEDMIPAEDKGAPMKPVEPKDSTDGTTQPDPTGERGLSPLPAPDGLAPLILTDPERDAIVFILPPKEPGYGLTQPSPVDQGGGRPPLPAPDGGDVMDFAQGFEGPGDFLF